MPYWLQNLQLKNKFFLLILPDDIIIKKNCSKKIISIHDKYHSSVIASKKVKNSEISRYGIIKYLKKLIIIYLSMI